MIPPALKRTSAFYTFTHWRHLLFDPEYRAKDRKALADFRRFCNESGGLGLRHNLLPRGCKPKTALVVSHPYLPWTVIESVMIKGLQMAGYEAVVLRHRRYNFMRYRRLTGNKTVFEYSDFDSQGDPEWVKQQAGQLNTIHDWMNLEYEGVHVGRFTLASAIRGRRVRQLDFGSPAVQLELRKGLEQSVQSAIRVRELFNKIKPDCVLVMDRGYTGVGEVFDSAINLGIDTITWEMGYRSNRLVVKRYHAGNEREQPLSTSAESWRQLRSVPWKPEYGRKLREELFQCYETQDWFSLVGTQFDKQILSQQMTRQRLGLSCDKQVAVIFPHILWDGSFFFGEDLFDDYTQWLIETIRSASANSRLQWVVRLHPSHVVKERLSSKGESKPAELAVIEKVFGTLPPHVKLLLPENELSTYSLFQIADYVVTVRGTVGIESALFGIPVVTAGTGRYDRRGFTLDSSTRQEYLEKLAALETYPRLSAEQVELAERYAYGVFFCRPLELSSVSFEFERDATATPKIKVHCQTRDQWLASPDMRRLSDWIADGKAEDMLILPPGVSGS
ncbi:MAG: hypothetical protein E8D42_17210 [Nitrospira sp.]|nr:MAG: hypothetical protein E8D42_17210 [Nitrospira sp.]